MAISKLILNGTTQMNVTDTTATASDVAQGKVFYAADGTITTGTGTGGGGDIKSLIDGSIAELTLPAGLKEIRAYAFYNCKSLDIDEIPNGIYIIGDYAFADCTSLALTALPDGLSNIGAYAFYRCAGITLSALPDNLTRIENGTFYGCTGITLASLPQQLIRIGSSAFYGCTGITISVIPATVTYIGSGAFNGCTGITSLDIPAGVSSLQGTFIDCHALTTVILRKTDAPVSISSTTFNNTPFGKYGGLTGTAYVPSALIEQYKTASNWSTMYNNGGCTFLPIEGSQYEL